MKLLRDNRHVHVGARLYSALKVSCPLDPWGERERERESQGEVALNT